ncbi:MAG: hypothetical protein N4A35_09100 [Flavobacteriales bacterium]|jgi:uncharacterized membrane protein YvbJ|nr:hypothetical protein [Flavobacteriales bacterium]
MESKIERKCSNCGQWNVGNQEFCQFCNAPISPKKIIETREEKRVKEEKEKPLDKIDLYLKRLKDHPNFFVRVLFRIVYSTWVVFMLIVSAVVYFVALTPG